MRDSVSSAVSRVNKGRGSFLPSELSFVREVVAHLSDGVVVADVEGNVLIANAAARRMAGKGLAGFSESDWSAQYGLFVPGTDQPFPPGQLPLARAIRGEDVNAVEIFVRNDRVPEGVWVSVSGKPLRDAGGSVWGGVVIIRDVTRRRLAEDTTHRLNHALEQTADAVFITDRGGTIEYVNPAFAAITGYSKEEALGSNPRILRSGVQGSDFYEGLWSTILSGETFRGMTVNRRKDGSLLHAEQTITPMTGGEEIITHFVSVLKDMTERRKVQEQETEMKIAANVQRRLFPSCAPRPPGYDLGGAAYSADATCGDYYDFLTISEDRLGIVVADVRGHGIGPALVMAQTRAYLRAFTCSNPDPGEILRRINNELNADLESGNFVTMLLAVLDLPTGEMVYANAGHPTAYIMNREGRLKADLRSTGLPLGLFPQCEFSNRTNLRLSSGDSLLILTDGILECESPDEQEFGVKRILDELSRHHKKRSGEIISALFAAACSFTKSNSQKDDMTFVVCKRL